MRMRELSIAALETCDGALTSKTADVDVDIDSTIALLGGSLTPHAVYTLCAWLVHSRTRTLEHSLLHLGLGTVRKALILDLWLETSLSLHEMLDLLCCSLNIGPRSASAVALSRRAMRPQERFQVIRKRFR